MSKQNKNKHGLSRKIPPAVRREVRKRSHFGCVKCGLFIYEYHHVDPLFSEATSHEPSNICLLCPTHHGKVHKGLISTQQVKEAYKKPYASGLGYSKETEFVKLCRPCNVHLGIFQL